jgi:hypothetical protein
MEEKIRAQEQESKQEQRGSDKKRRQGVQEDKKIRRSRTRRKGTAFQN